MGLPGNGAVPTGRLYGGTVALVTGSYAAWVAVETAEAVAAHALLAVGVILALHGVALFVPRVAAVGRLNGLAMLGYAGTVFLLLGWREVLAEAPGSPAERAVGADPGLVALGALVLLSGAVLSLRREALR